MTTQIQIAKRTDSHGTYYTPIVPTPSGDGTMAADILSDHGRTIGPRYSSVAEYDKAIARHLEICAHPFNEDFAYLAYPA